jgi:Rieske Fe-S protein
MKRSPALSCISRREFCAAIGLATGGLVIAGCSSDSGNGTPDATTTPDAAGSGGGGACATSGTDVGSASTFVLNTPVYVASGRFFVVRDSGGLFAVSARCTHQGVTVAVSGAQYRCPAHGATFKFDGTVTSGPASTSLVHYAMCTLANGHIGVSATTTVSAATRLAV